MRILVCGDIHCKPELIQKATGATKWDKFVFLGDACDNWGATQEDNLNTLQAVKELKEKYGDKFVWLMGNHDWGYYDSTILMTGHIRRNEKIIHDFLVESKDLWELVHFDRQYIFSHAGLSADFVHFTENISFKDMKEIMGYENPVNMVGRESGGYDPAPSFLWARPSEFAPLPDVLHNVQIVGHTPVEKITFENGVIICDTMSQYSDGKPIGDKSLLLIDTETGKMTAVNFEGKELYDVEYPNAGPIHL